MATSPIRFMDVDDEQKGVEDDEQNDVEDERIDVEDEQEGVCMRVYASSNAYTD